MALVPETGAGDSGANSYNDYDEANTYFADRPSAKWHDANQESRVEALIVGSYWLNGRYAWLGTPHTDTDRPLFFPPAASGSNSGKDYTGEVPQGVKEAALEAADLYLDGKIDLTLSRDGRVVREKLGPLETEYAETAQGARSYTFIDALVADVSCGLRKGGARRLRRF